MTQRRGQRPPAPRLSPDAAAAAAGETGRGRVSRPLPPVSLLWPGGLWRRSRVGGGVWTACVTWCHLRGEVAPPRGLASWDGRLCPCAGAAPQLALTPCARGRGRETRWGDEQAGQASVVSGSGAAGWTERRPGRPRCRVPCFTGAATSQLLTGLLGGAPPTSPRSPSRPPQGRASGPLPRRPGSGGGGGGSENEASPCGLIAHRPRLGAQAAGGTLLTDKGAAVCAHSPSGLRRGRAPCPGLAVTRRAPAGCRLPSCAGRLNSHRLAGVNVRCSAGNRTGGFPSQCQGQTGASAGWPPAVWARRLGLVTQAEGAGTRAPRGLGRPPPTGGYCGLAFLFSLLSLPMFGCSLFPESPVLTLGGV